MVASPPPPSPGRQRCAPPTWEESATRICRQVRRSMQGEREEAPWSSPLSPARGCLSCWLSCVGNHLRRSPRRSPQPEEADLPGAPSARPWAVWCKRKHPEGEAGVRSHPALHLGPCRLSRKPSCTSGTPAAAGRWPPGRRRKTPVSPGPRHPTGSPHFFTRPPTPGLPDGELPARLPSARRPGRRGDSVATRDAPWALQGRLFWKPQPCRQEPPQAGEGSLLTAKLRGSWLPPGRNVVSDAAPAMLGLFVVFF